MHIMPGRYRALQEALAAYGKTDAPLVAYRDGAFYPAGGTDNVGIYYFIPKLARAFDWPLDTSIEVFFGGIIIMSLFLGLMGSFLLFKSLFSKVISFIALVNLAYIAFNIGDQYIILYAVPVLIIPLFLFFMGRKSKGRNHANFKFFTFTFVFISGLIIGTSHFLRSYSGVATLIFMLIIITFSCLHLNHTRKFLIISAILLGILIPNLYFNQLLSQRDSFLQDYSSQELYTPTWHIIYLGFGFLNNDYGIKYDDVNANKKVESISPTTPIYSKKYNEILKKFILQLIRKDPNFALKTLFAKLGVLMMFLINFANIGLIASFVYRKKWPIELAFWSAISFSAIFGILAIPARHYLLGFVSFSTLYGLVGIDHAIQCGIHKDLLRLASLTRSRF